MFIDIDSYTTGLILYCECKQHSQHDLTCLLRVLASRLIIDSKFWHLSLFQIDKVTVFKQYNKLYALLTTTCLYSTPLVVLYTSSSCKLPRCVNKEKNQTITCFLSIFSKAMMLKVVLASFFQEL